MREIALAGTTDFLTTVDVDTLATLLDIAANQTSEWDESQDGGWGQTREEWQHLHVEAQRLLLVLKADQ